MVQRHARHAAGRHGGPVFRRGPRRRRFGLRQQQRPELRFHGRPRHLQRPVDPRREKLSRRRRGDVRDGNLRGRGSRSGRPGFGGGGRGQRRRRDLDDQRDGAEPRLGLRRRRVVQRQPRHLRRRHRGALLRAGHGRGRNGRQRQRRPVLPDHDPRRGPGHHESAGQRHGGQRHGDLHLARHRRGRDQRQPALDQRAHRRLRRVPGDDAVESRGHRPRRRRQRRHRVRRDLWRRRQHAVGQGRQLRRRLGRRLEPGQRLRAVDVQPFAGHRLRGHLRRRSGAGRNLRLRQHQRVRLLRQPAGLGRQRRSAAQLQLRAGSGHDVQLQAGPELGQRRRRLLPRLQPVGRRYGTRLHQHEQQ